MNLRHPLWKAIVAYAEAREAYGTTSPSEAAAARGAKHAQAIEAFISKAEKAKQERDTALAEARALRAELDGIRRSQDEWRAMNNALNYCAKHGVDPCDVCGERK